MRNIVANVNRAAGRAQVSPRPKTSAVEPCAAARTNNVCSAAVAQCKNFVLRRSRTRVSHGQKSGHLNGSLNGSLVQGVLNRRFPVQASVL